MSRRERRVDTFGFRPQSAMLRDFLRGLEADGWHMTSVVRTQSANSPTRERVIVTAERPHAGSRSRRARQRGGRAP